MTDKKIFPQSPSLDSEIERVLAGRTLRRSDQLRKLLSYLGQVSVEEDASALSESAIGTRVFGRRDFNPKLDTIVRSEMLRLRRKLDDYYATEAPESTHRISFDRNSYCPMLAARDPAAPEPSIAAPPVAVRDQRPFWAGLVTGVAVTAVVAALLFAWAGPKRVESPASPLAKQPLWTGFASTPVDVLIGTPLFFLNPKGFQRVFSLNFPEDLPDAEKQLSIWPAYPYWDLWAPYENLSGSVALTHALGELGSKAAFFPARDKSVSTLSGRHTIIIGHPRFAPLLADVLAEDDFRPDPHTKGHTFGGFRNFTPRPGESEVYNIPPTTLEQRSDESMPDHALISSKLLPGGGEVLSIFGNRVQTGGFLMRALLEKPLLDQLNSKVFVGGNGKRHQNAQVVLRVDYSKGKPTGAVYLTHRIRY